MIKLKNIYLVFKDQLPLKRMFINLFIKRNYGIFKKSSHFSSKSGTEKVKYNTKETAVKSSFSMQKKTGVRFAAYKCLYCDKYHIGK